MASYLASPTHDATTHWCHFAMPYLKTSGKSERETARGWEREIGKNCIMSPGQTVQRSAALVQSFSIYFVVFVVVICSGLPDAVKLCFPAIKLIHLPRLFHLPRFITSWCSKMVLGHAERDANLSFHCAHPLFICPPPLPSKIPHWRVRLMWSINYDPRPVHLHIHYPTMSSRAPWSRGKENKIDKLSKMHTSPQAFWNDSFPKYAQ